MIDSDISPTAHLDRQVKILERELAELEADRLAYRTRAEHAERELASLKAEECEECESTLGDLMRAAHPSVATWSCLKCWNAAIGKATTEVAEWKRRYLLVADAVARESTSAEDLARRARATRAALSQGRPQISKPSSPAFSEAASEPRNAVSSLCLSLRLLDFHKLRSDWVASPRLGRAQENREGREMSPRKKAERPTTRQLLALLRGKLCRWRCADCGFERDGYCGHFQCHACRGVAGVIIDDPNVTAKTPWKTALLAQRERRAAKK